MGDNNILELIKKKYQYLNICEEEWNLIARKIEDTNDKKKYHKKIVLILRKYVLGKFNSSKSKEFLNNYLSGLDYNEVLNKYSLLLKELKIELDLDNVIELLNENKILYDAVDNLAILNINKIKNCNTDEISDDNHVINLIDAYTIINNININVNDFAYDDLVNNLNESHFFKGKDLTKKLLTREEELKLLKKYKEGDNSAKELLLLNNWKLIANMAKKYVGRTYFSFMDLFQEGCIGFLEAIDKYDEKRCARLTTYAVWLIRKSLFDAMYDKSSLIRKPTYLVQNKIKLQRIIDDYKTECGIEPKIEELSSLTGWNKETIEKLLKLPEVSVSLNKKITDTEELELGDMLFDEEENSKKENLILKEDIKELIRICNFTPRELYILTLRMGLDGNGVRTLEQIGQHLNITRQRVKQIEEGILNKFREYKKIKSYALYTENYKESCEYIDEYNKNKVYKKKSRSYLKANDNKKNENKITLFSSIYTFFCQHPSSHIELMLKFLSDDDIQLLQKKYGSNFKSPNLKK